MGRRSVSILCVNCSTDTTVMLSLFRPLTSAMKEIVCTDTLPVNTEKLKSFHTLSVAPLFADVIKNVAEKKSVSGLYI